MARYEKLGFCPHNSFADADLFPNKAMILGVLGNRTADMYYPEDDKAWSEARPCLAATERWECSWPAS